jgi:formylglycine-generating enzyme required for sulfatase activity
VELARHGPAFLLRRAVPQCRAVRVALQHFAQELARRRVARVLIAYVVAVFGALQGLDVMVTRLELPSFWMRWAVLLALAGLPAAAVLSWIFDWTSKGVVRTPPAAHAPQQHRAAVTTAALALLIGALAWFAIRDYRYRTTRTQLDEAIHLADKGKLVESLALAFEVEKALPAAQALQKLWPEISRVLEVQTNPPGALVQIRPYGASDSEWRTLGTTPIIGARISILPSQVRITKGGYIPADRGLWRYLPFQAKLSADLMPLGSVPDGMIAIPGGPMGWLPLVGLENVKSEEVPPAYLGKLEVTNAEYRKFVEDGGYRRREFWKEPFAGGLSFEQAMARFRDRTGQPGPSTWSSGDYPEGQHDFPVTGVSWYEAAAYANWAGKSLPTIFHWARGATTWAAPDVVPRSNFGPAIQRVGASGGVSGFGLLDMAGNAKEWVWNERNGNRYILGGGYGEPPYMFNDPDAQPPFERRANFGFRVAQCPQPMPAALLARLSSRCATTRGSAPRARRPSASTPASTATTRRRSKRGPGRWPKPTAGAWSGSASTRLIAARGWRRSSSRRRTSPRHGRR